MSAESRGASLHIVNFLFVHLLFAFVFCCMYGAAPGAVAIIKIEISLASQVLRVPTNLRVSRDILSAEGQSLVQKVTMSVISA